MTAACQELIEQASQRWAEEEGDYRDDVRSFECFLFLILFQYHALIYSLFSLSFFTYSLFFFTDNRNYSQISFTLYVLNIDLYKFIYFTYNR